VAGLELKLFVGTIAANGYVKVVCDNTSAELDGANLSSGVSLANNTNYNLYSDGANWRKLSVQAI